ASPIRAALLAVSRLLSRLRAALPALLRLTALPALLWLAAPGLLRLLPAALLRLLPLALLRGVRVLLRDTTARRPGTLLAARCELRRQLAVLGLRGRGVLPAGELEEQLLQVRALFLDAVQCDACFGRHVTDLLHRREIGRASCRERDETAVGAAW